MSTPTSSMATQIRTPSLTFSTQQSRTGVEHTSSEVIDVSLFQCELEGGVPVCERCPADNYGVE